MSEEDRPGRRQDRERDLILGPGEYANILDETKGHVSIWVGPSKASLSATDRPVVFDPEQRKFVECSLEESILTFPFAAKGHYIVLHNPTQLDEGGESEEPMVGSNGLTKLQYGNKINIEGPKTFALWPGQVAEVRKGHQLRSNQYLVVKVYDEEAAKANWNKAVIKLQKKEGTEKIEAPELTMGKLILIEGTKVSFYIPPTGIEIVPDKDKKFIRQAVTLERLEYCILLDEDGNKRYVQGPDVVFPEPTENFIEKEERRKFKAIELNELMGLYVKVIADYKEGDKEYKTGDELFITGEEQRIYYPRPEHAIIKYGDQQIYYAIAIPEGEARYVLNRITGEISLETGPSMFLPDPREKVIIRRIIDPKTAELWFPGNKGAAAYNANLKKMTVEADYVEEDSLAPRSSNVSRTLSKDTKADVFAALTATEELQRKQKFTPPRTVTLDTKYEGAVTIDVWPGYAVQVVKRTGERTVVEGPKVHLLKYDETLEKISFSTGTPKTNKNLIETVYLRVLHNTISDMIVAETKDLCPVNVTVSYRVNFEGDSKIWFNVENYVKFLTDHLRSVIRNKIKQVNIEDFYANNISIVRDTVLGEHKDDSRKGKKFEENGVRVYDIEVLGIEIDDDEIFGLLVESEHDNIAQKLNLVGKERELQTTKQTEKIQREIDTAESETLRKKYELNVKDSEKELESELARIKVESESQRQGLIDTSEQKDIENQIGAKALEIKKATQDQDLEFANSKIEQEIKKLQAETTSTTDKAKAIKPELLLVLQEFANKDLAGKLAENLNVLSILGGKGKTGIEILQELLGGSGLGNLISEKINLHVHAMGKNKANKVNEE